MLRIVMLLALLALPTALIAHPLPADLAAAVQQFEVAQLNNDAPALQSLLAEEFVLIGGGGRVVTKSDFIADSTRPDFKRLPPTLDEPVQTVWADGAIVGGRRLATWIDHGKQGQQLFRYANVWVKRDGHWRVVYAQVTRLPLPSPTGG